MEISNSVPFWSTFVPLAFAAFLSMAIYIIKFAMPLKNLRGGLWWLLYTSVCVVFACLFIAITTGLRILAGLESDPAYYWFALAGIYGYLLIVAYVPAAIAINKVLAHRYPLPWEKNYPKSSGKVAS